MSVYDLANRLAKQIKNSDEYEDYLEKKKKVMQNEKTKEMLIDFQQEQMKLQAKQLSGEDLTEEEKDVVERSINENFNQFLGVISDSTGMNKTQIERLADGSSYYGSYMFREGLVDDIGGLEEALDEVERFSDKDNHVIDYISIGDAEFSSGTNLRGYLYMDPKYLQKPE